MSSTKVVLLKLCILLLLYELAKVTLLDLLDRISYSVSPYKIPTKENASSLIIPEEVPTVLSLIYSNIPPIKKGTDSRVGVGFRLGEHADFQVLIELGPQTETNPIGSADSKRRRDAMLNAAMRGELGPLAQAVVKYQMERKLQRELERLKKTEKLKGTSTVENVDKKSAASEWLTKWSKDMSGSSEDQPSLEDQSGEKNASNSVKKKTVQRIGRPPASNGEKTTISDLTKLYKVQSDEKNE